MAKPVTMTSGRSIDWLAMARVHADLAVKEFRGDSSYDLRLGTFLAVINPLDERAQHATIAQACIAMHNAEAGSGAEMFTTQDMEGIRMYLQAAQPQPFDCEEVIQETW